MEYRRLGRTGVKVSEFSLGTMTFGGRFANIGVVSQGDANHMVALALREGVNLFDTADVYSRGESEEILGKALKSAGVPRHSVVIATKVRGSMSDAAADGSGDVNNLGLSRKHIFEAVDASLRRLHTDYIDLYQIHGIDVTTRFEETLEALNDLVRQGKVLYIGCSNLTARHLMKTLGMSERHGWARFDSLQAYYSLAGRDVEHELLPLCIEEGLGMLVWSPLSGGLLTGKYQHGRPEVGRRLGFDFPHVAPHTDDLLRVVETVARAHHVSMARVALAWLGDQPGVTSVILGARDVDQLEDDLAAAHLKLSRDDLEKLGRPTAPQSLYPQWMMDMQRAGGRPTAVDAHKAGKAES